MSKVVGIDLGTTNSVVAYTDPSGTTRVIAGTDGSRVVPSVVHFTQDGDVVVGDQAKAYAKVEPSRVAQLFKRGMGEKTFLPSGQPFEVDGKEWSPEELSSLVLKKLMQNASDDLGEPVSRAIITVPFYFGEPERAATRAAGELAGIEVEQVINEPTAAAISHGIDTKGQEGRLLVFDLGGGTFDVTVMEYGPTGEMTVIGGAGDRELGGADFDQAILDRMIEFVEAEAGVDLTADEWLLAEAAARAEEMKKELSTNSESTRPISVEGKPLMFKLTRSEFEEMIEEQRQLVEDAVMFALDQGELGPSDLTDALMVGGSSRIPLFQELLAKILGRDPLITKNLDEDVARGASMIAARKGEELDPRSELAQMPVPTDAASHAVGVEVVGPRNAVVIPRGVPLPFSETLEEFSTASDHQTHLELKVLEGEDEDVEFCRVLGSATGAFDQPKPEGYPLRIEVSYSEDQMIKILVYDGQSMGLVCELEIEHAGLLSDEEKEVAMQEIATKEVG